MMKDNQEHIVLKKMSYLKKNHKCYWKSPYKVKYFL